MAHCGGESQRFYGVAHGLIVRDRDVTDTPCQRLVNLAAGRGQMQRY